jgi:hypothetical protein
VHPTSLNKCNWIQKYRATRTHIDSQTLPYPTPTIRQ